MKIIYKRVKCAGCSHRLFDMSVSGDCREKATDCFVMIKCGRCKEIMLVNLSDRKVVQAEERIVYN